MPQTLDQLAQCYLQYPQAKLLAGGTDLALEVTQRHQDLPLIIAIGQLAELRQIERGERLRIGAGVTLSELYRALAEEHPALGALLQR
ncbi:FAD binding domain-containing protein, partial [Pseudomonas shirazica]